MNLELHDCQLMTVSYMLPHLVQSCLADRVVDNAQALLISLNLSESGRPRKISTRKLVGYKTLQHPCTHIILH